MKRYLAESIGTFALVFAGTAAIVINELNGGVISHVGVALTFGLVVMAMIYSCGGRFRCAFEPRRDTRVLGLGANVAP